MAEFDLHTFFTRVKALHTPCGAWDFDEEPMADSLFFEMEYTVGTPVEPRSVQVYATPYWEGSDHLDVDITYGDDRHVTMEIPFDAFSGNYDALANRYMERVAPILAFAKMLALADARVDVF